MILLEILIVIHVTVYVIRLLLMKSYYNSMKVDCNNKNPEIGKLFSVIQPIVSGDPDLKADLLNNLKNSSNLQFIWVVDESDLVAKQVVDEIKENSIADIKIIVAKNISPSLNEKVVKQSLALPYCRDYIIALDDDTIISFDKLSNIKERLDTRPCVITALPYYRKGRNFFSNLVTGFVNGNTLITYLVMAKMNSQHTLNGMCYFVKKETITKLNIFKRVEDKLSDEYEIAKILDMNNIIIEQDILPCSVGTTILNLTHYFNLMKRWMVFVNIYMRESLCIYTFLLIALPTIFPVIIFTASILISYKLLLICFMVQFTICIVNYYTRYKLLNANQHLKSVIYELLSYFIQPIHFVNSLIKSNEIIWRKNKVLIKKDGKIEYIKVEE